VIILEYLRKKRLEALEKQKRKGLEKPRRKEIKGSEKDKIMHILSKLESKENGYSNQKYAANIFQEKYKPGQYRWYRYIKSNDPTIEKEIFDKIQNLSGEDFKTYLLSIQKHLNYKYRVRKKGLKNTIFKRSMYNVINKHTNELPYERIKQIERFFPLLKRVYFGPALNKFVYNRKKVKKNFQFKIKSDHTIPQLNSIIDLAYFFKIRVNDLLGYSYNQKKSKYFYIKQKKIFEQFGESTIPENHSF